MDSQSKTRQRRRRKRKSSAAQPYPETPLEELSPEESRKRLLERMAQAAKLCRGVQAILKQEPGPELETILQLHRLLVLKHSAEAEGAPELLKLVSLLIKPLLDWARLEETRKERELTEQKYRDEAALQQAVLKKAKDEKSRALRQETLEKIEHELRLF